MNKHLATPPPPAIEGEPDLIDFKRVAELLGFIFGSVKRHRWLAGTLFVLTCALSIAALKVLPRTFHVQATLLAQRNQVMAALGNPRRAMPGEADMPTRAAYETVLKHDNLVALIKQTDLLDNWDQTRAPLARLKDWVLQVVRGPLDDQERMDALVGLLEKRLQVTIGEGTITIGIDWPDAGMAFRLVESAQQNFLESRHAAEVSTIAEAISILEGHAATVHESIESVLDEIHKLQSANRRPGAAPVVRRRLGGSESPADKDLAQLRVMLAAKQRAISDLEEFRRRRLAELQATLSEQKTTYTPAHPVIVNTEQSIAALAKESPQIATLKKEEQEIRREFEAHGGKNAKDPSDSSLPPPPPREELETVRREVQGSAEDESVDYARSRLRIASNKYEDLLDRIDAARIELETARAAFKYRYSVITPAQLPKKSVKPNPAMLLGGGLGLAVALAFFASTLSDVWSRRIVERWQVERNLNLPVLSEVRRR